MQQKFTSPLMVVLMGILFLALVLLNNQLFQSARIDLTQDKVYSLSQGSKDIIQQLDEPVHLYFFFSDKTSQGMTSLRNYADRVRSLLEEYANHSDGMLQLHLIDPEPFSEAEDQADQFGLTAATIGASGDAVYMGLAGRNALDDELTIPFFDPQQESALEYEISKLIYKLSDPNPVKVVMLTDLPVSGGQNPMTGRFDPPWTFYSQLQQLYQVQTLPGSASELPADVDVLILLHPKGLNEELLYSIDQYAMGGGKILLMLDPHNESDMTAAMSGMSMGANGSELTPLLKAWGVDYDGSQVVLDAANGLEIQTPQGEIVRHMGILGLGFDALEQQDVLTSNLEIINGASFGHLAKSSESQGNWQPLLSSSQNSSLMDSTEYAMTREPGQLAEKLGQTLQQYTLAARLSGKANSAYTAESAIGGKEHIGQTETLNLILVADSDWLHDRFWVQTANFFGETIVTPFANNGDLVTNAVENLGGSHALISIRGRGTFARPFSKVDEITLVAEQKFRQQEQLLQQQLQDTEQQLLELQQQQGDSSTLILSPEQQRAIDEFVNKKVEIRQALREVRHQLDKDIELLGSWLKFINITLMPLLLVLILFLIRRGLVKSSRHYFAGE